MEITPLIADLNKYKEELAGSIEAAMWFNELKMSDEYVAHDLAEIKGLNHSDQPFQQVANLYRLSVEEVVRNIRDFTNKTYKHFIWSDLELMKDKEFDS